MARSAIIHSQAVEHTGGLIKKERTMPFVKRAAYSFLHSIMFCVK